MKMESKSIQEELEIRIGCTGWSYPAWQGTFYPKGLKENILLKHYSKILLLLIVGIKNLSNYDLIYLKVIP